MIQSSSSLHPISSLSSPNSHIPKSPFSNPPILFLKFRTTYRDNLRYLKSIGIATNPKFPPNPSPESLIQILSTVNFLKSKGFSDSNFAKLAFATPKIFSPHFNPTDLQPLFDFLTNEDDLAASPEDACGLILRCPEILESNVEFCLKPTLFYLRREIGIEHLNSPTNLNAHLLNTRFDKLQEKVDFLQSIGFSYEESTRICARLPAIFGYSIENNLRPKYQYLVRIMGRSLDELKEFPQYFGFSLEKRIMPRHMHLKVRNVDVSLKRMLLWSDQKFYAKWK